MDEHEKLFHRESRIKAMDLEHRRKINYSLMQSDLAFQKGKNAFQDLESARKKAKNIKWDTIEHLNKYLLEFEKKFTERGGKVIWAENPQQALDAVLHICKQKQAKSVVKSKSMVTEEIHLNSFLSRHEIEVVETDLGEYIQQLSAEPPYHMVAPSMHKSREEVAKLFHDKLNAPPGLAPGEITLFTRQLLRQKYVDADIGITGVNFLLADIGAVAITENEGNARLCTGFPKTHIAITGIEKILPSVKDLALFWPLLATHGSGQQVTVYNTIISGAKKENEIDGPEDMYVILLDNGRTNILADVTARESLFCIRCGACLNVCPVFKNIGGHTYKATYSGPIGSVITPYLSGLKSYKHLSYASSLCGACTQVCPVHINLHELLLYNRNQSVKARCDSRSERAGWALWKRACLSRAMMNMTNGRIKNFMIKLLFRQSWGDSRSLPDFAPKTFNELWKTTGQ